MLLAASSASAGKKTVLLDCDLRLRTTSEALRRRHEAGLSDFLCGAAKLTDVITHDPVTNINLIPAGSAGPNAADLLMSQGMLDLIAVLRNSFDYVIMDSPPVAAGCGRACTCNWRRQDFGGRRVGRTPHATIYEAFRVLGPEANRVAAVVLNKVDFDELPGYGGHEYRKYFNHA